MTRLRRGPGTAPSNISGVAESQPIKDNIEGRREKASRNLVRISKRTHHSDVFAPAEQPGGGPESGFGFVETAAERLNSPAAGIAAHLFPTGQGNIIGNPSEAVIELAGDPDSVRAMSGHVDLEVFGLPRRAMTLDQAGNSLKCRREPAAAV